MTAREYHLGWIDGQHQRQSVIYVDADRAVMRYRELKADPTTQNLVMTRHVLDTTVRMERMSPDADR